MKINYNAKLTHVKFPNTKPTEKPGKCVESHDLAFGEPVKFAGGADTMRVYTGDYSKDGSEAPPGGLIPPGMLNYR